jgi:hypothetical protein
MIIEDDKDSLFICDKKTDTYSIVLMRIMILQ